ncbi:MAG: ribonuclease Z [bacterium]
MNSYGGSSTFTKIQQPVSRTKLQATRIKQPATSNNNKQPNSMLEIVFLGTGAAVPTRFRNLSGTAMIRQGEIFLFDCGEGTQIQFRKAHLRPGRLSRIFISHFHGDHFFGLPGLLTSMQMADCKQPIHLYGPQGLSEYIEFHKKMAKFGLGYPLQIYEVPNASNGMVWQEDDYRIVSKPLRHRIRCLGWAIVENARPGKFDSVKADDLGIPHGPERSHLQQGESIVLANGQTVSPDIVMGPARRGYHFAYCLDTAPAPATIALAQGADVLIHDATFKADEEESALKTGHSTVTHAAQIARDANVRLLVLNHISGRYMPHDEDELLRTAKNTFHNTIIAQDLKRIQLDYED